jgi:Domain of unknown function (DUF4440)
MPTNRASRLRAACLTTVLVVCAPVMANEAPPAVHRQIVALTQTLMDALGEGKPEVWETILADDVLITDEFGRRQTKAEAVKGIHRFPPGMSGSIEVRDAHVRHYGGTAVIDCEAYEQETVFGQKLVVRYLFTSTFVRRGGAWKLVAMQDVTLPTQPPALSVGGLKLADYPGTYRYGPERAFFVALEQDKLVWRTKAGGIAHALDPIAKDVFMGGDDEKNLLIFRRDDAGHVSGLIERRKFNDLHLQREAPGR